MWSLPPTLPGASHSRRLIRQAQSMGITAQSRGPQPHLLKWLKKDFLEEGQLGPQVTRAGARQARGCGEHSLKTFQNKGESVGKYHLGPVSTRTWPENLHFHSSLGPKVGGRPGAFPGKPFVQEPLPRGTQPRMASSVNCLDFILPFLFSIGTYPLFMGQGSWDHRAISP